MSIETQNPVRRAGFWRRFGSFLVDGAIILLPLEVVVAILFAMTDGQIQGRFGLNVLGCQALTQLPPGLQTQITNPNGAAKCAFGLPGLPTANVLVVSRSEKNGAVTTTVSESFWLDAKGDLAAQAGYDVTWIAVLILFTYIVACEVWRGRTIGDRMVRTRVVDAAHSDIVGIPFGRSIGRRVAMMIGTIPAAIVLTPVFSYRYDAAALAAYTATPFYRYGMIVSVVIGLAWLILIVVAIARKKDPIYDRIARTAVIRT